MRWHHLGVSESNLVQAKNDNTGTLKERIRQTLLAQPQATITVLSSLLAIQDELHYIPVEAIEEVAIFCDVTINEVWGVAEYYTNFRFEKPSKTTVQVCWGPTCHILGAQKVLDAIKTEFKVGDGADDEIEIEYNTCLGACAHAPVVAFAHVLSGKMDEKRVVELIKDKVKSENGK